MDLPFNHRPGRRERHLRRRHKNPLFAWPPQEVAPEDLLAAQRADHADLEAFGPALRDLLERAAALPPNADSQVVLDLKEALETQYEQSHALPGDHAEARAALARLIALIMQSIRRQAGVDPIARQELGEEETARAIHFRLLEQPLVTDLLHPDSVVAPEELAATLLSASTEEVAAACELFDGGQMAVLVHRGQALLAQLAEVGAETAAAQVRLSMLQQRLEQYDQADAGR
ncbi:MAG: hypothetical protein EA400_02090 [Chromatiaceae bacterium]|nr:MAG: hypothetical protein EA400_02090 [Chromatiaceae bacterium]